LIFAVSDNVGSFSASSIGILRMLRLTKVCRFVRMVRAVPELVVLIKGLAAASRAVVWTLNLLIVVVYIFAVAARIITDDKEVGKMYFSSVTSAMLTLSVGGLLPDNAEDINIMGDLNAFVAAVFVFFLVVASITLMNMLIGVLCESVSAIATIERETISVAYVKAEVEALVQETGRDVEALLTREDVEEIMLSPKAGRVFSNVGVDVEGMVEVADIRLFKDSDQVRTCDLVGLVLQLRGQNIATVKDIVNLQKFIVEEWSFLAEKISVVVRAVDRASKAPKSMSTGGIGDHVIVPALDNGMQASGFTPLTCLTTPANSTKESTKEAL